jgi:hypothetical protein
MKKWKTWDALWLSPFDCENEFSWLKKFMEHQGPAKEIPLQFNLSRSGSI